jgi:ATP-dependent RNA helicase RhlE
MRQLRKILEVLPRKRQNLLFSATFSDKVEELSAEFLEFPSRIEDSPHATPAKEVEQELYHVPNLNTKLNFCALIKDKEQYQSRDDIYKTKEVADSVYGFIENRSLGPRELFTPIKVRIAGSMPLMSSKMEICVCLYLRM